MSILIQGMEMPKEMRTLTIFPNGYVAVHNSFDTFESETKAIQIPPHGRLIDADELLTSKSVGTQIAGWGKMYHETCIEYAPTIIPADKENF